MEEKFDGYKKVIQAKTNEDLIQIIQNKTSYEKEFVNLAIEELKSRNFDVSAIDNPQFLEKEIWKNLTDEEVIEIFVNPDYNEKSRVALAKKEIEKRKLPLKELTAEQILSKENFRNGEYGRYMWLGYIVSFAGGLLGIFMALQYLYSTKKNVDGERFHTYNQKTRKNAKALLIISFIVIALIIIMKIS
ncbi:MAG: hypothetical protein LBR17_07505 [Bacteroidales bacterium]|jgi:3-dehydroquinate dehydratase|nr:hypothetical protein [Bacteroidales bacterium]